MTELNISTFIQTMQAVFMTNKGQEAAALLLLNSINQQEYVGEKFGVTDLSSKKISNIVNRKSPVPDSIVKASLDGNVIKAVKEYFYDDVLGDINPQLEDDLIANIVNLIQSDITVSDKKKETLLGFNVDGNLSDFLAEVFLYAINKPNVKQDTAVQYEDAPLLAEANYECPLKHEKLVEYVKEKPVRRYIVTQIYPDDLSAVLVPEFDAISPKPKNLNAPDNLITLCERCSTDYLANPTAEEYKKLREIKTKISRSYTTRIEADKIALEDDIRVVLNALAQLSDSSKLIELEYDALRIDEKIKPESFLLKNDIKINVLNYYKYIESVFSSSEVDFDSIATEIKLCSTKLEKSGMSQEDVVLHLAEWIRDKAGIPVNSLMACHIVVAFFVQNCEVFHK